MKEISRARDNAQTITEPASAAKGVDMLGHESGGPAGRDLSRVLAEHVTSFRFADLSPAVLNVTHTALMDQIGVMIAASTQAPVCDAFVDLARIAGPGTSTVIGHRFRTSPMMAAFANGAMAHALDFEDTHDDTLVHPHAPVIAAALAIAENVGSSGKDFVTAVAVGADLSCRLALGFESQPEENGFLLFPTIGTFGAAAAVARLLGLSAHQTIQALAMAFGQATQSVRIKNYPPSDIRAVRDAFNAKAAVVSALLAQRGVEAFDQPLEGENGYYAIYASDGFDPSRVLEGLGREMRGAEVSFKPWPCCRGAHPFVEAALELRDSFAVSDIANVHVEVNSFFRSLCEPVEQRRRPQAAIGAKFSIPFSVGVALSQGDVTLRDFTPERIVAPEVLGLADLVQYSVSSHGEHRDATRGAMTVILKDGRRFHKEVPNPRGHPANPMGADEIARKFLSCLDYAAVPYDAFERAALQSGMRAIDQMPSVAGLL